MALEPQGGRMTPTAYPCPVCEFEMMVKPYKNGVGFKYECLGTEENRHTVQLYVRLDFPESAGVAVMQPGEPNIVQIAKVGEKTESLLERVKQLSGKGEK
jgi:hypothetical protein